MIRDGVNEEEVPWWFLTKVIRKKTRVPKKQNPETP